MPRDTFLRLPQEKRERILEAAWREFEAVPFADASINRIVRAAGIPRGSFYQYFEDKTDLFRHLLREMYAFMMDGFLKTLRGSGGDLFAAMLDCYDAFLKLEAQGEGKRIERYITVLKRNPGMELQQMSRCNPSQLREDVTREVFRYLDRTRIRCPDEAHCEALNSLCFGSLASALVSVRSGELTAAQGREHLVIYLDYLKCGALPQQDGAGKEALV